MTSDPDPITSADPELDGGNSLGAESRVAQAAESVQSAEAVSRWSEHGDAVDPIPVVIVEPSTLDLSVDHPDEVERSAGDVGVAPAPSEMLSGNYEPDPARPSVDEAPAEQSSDGSLVRRLSYLLAALVLVAVGTTTWRVLEHDSRAVRPDVALSSADDRRVPAVADELWSVLIPGAGSAKSTEILVHDRDLVMAVIDDGSRARSAIVGLDATDGSRRWRRGFAFAPEEFRLIGVLDGVLVAQQSDASQRRRLIALDVETGETRWELPAQDGGLYSVLVGTDVITRFPLSGNGTFDFVSPENGEVIDSIEGSLASTDLDGGWFFWAGGALVLIDLDLGIGTDFEGPAASDADPVDQTVVARSSTVTRDGVARDVDTGDVVRSGDRTISIAESGDLVELVLDGDPTPIALSGTDLTADEFVVDDLVPVGGDRFVIRSRDVLVGADLGPTSIEAVWERNAQLVAVAPTERGVVMLVRSVGLGLDRLDDEYLVIDAVSGVEIGRLNVPRDDSVEPIIAGDGFVLRRSLGDGEELSGFDLDGGALWTVGVAGRVQLGDRILVSLEATDSGYLVTAFGDPL